MRAAPGCFRGPLVGIARGPQKAGDIRINLLKAALIEAEVLLATIRLVDDDEHRTVTSAIADGLHPLVNRALIVLAPVFEHQEIETALGQEEAVGTAHHLLAAEVPDIELHLAIAGRPCLGQDLLVLKDPGRSGLIGVTWLSLDQVAEQRCLADRLVADDEQLQLVQRA